jgi:hypothetical protein
MTYRQYEKKRIDIERAIIETNAEYLSKLSSLYIELLTLTMERDRQRSTSTK